MVYSCAPHSPWQPGPCENTNGLVRQYLTKDADLSAYNQNRRNAIANLLNKSPRAIHNLYPPVALHQALLDKLNQPNSSIQ